MDVKKRINRHKKCHRFNHGSNIDFDFELKLKMVIGIPEGLLT